MTGPIQRVAVIGTTAWGTTLAVQLARNGVEVALGARSTAEAEELSAAGEHAGRLPGVRFPNGLRVVKALEAVRGAELVCLVVPSQSMAENVRTVRGGLLGDATLLSGTKGFEPATGRRMSEVIADEAPGHPIAALSGPNLSREVAAGLPTTTVIASRDAPLEALRDAFHAPHFRVYTSRDVIGVELGGALKNVVAIAAGIVDHYAFGNNAKAAVITRGLAEITRLATAAGADPLTLQGLAGIGDLIATSYSPLSRNRRLGELLASGATLEAALETIGETAEGASTVPAALRLAERYGVELPVTAGLDRIMHGGVAPSEVIEALLAREPTSEGLRGLRPG